MADSPAPLAPDGDDAPVRVQEIGPAGAGILRVTRTDLFTRQLGKIHQNNGNDYYTGEQIKTALNALLGTDGWSFRVLEHGYEEMSDEFWVLGELSARIWVADPNDEEGVVAHTVVKQQFGGQNVKRSRKDGSALSTADDRKGAATDALKKCAAELGFGLHLSAKDPGADLPYRRSEDEPYPIRYGQGRPFPNGAQAPNMPPDAPRGPQQAPPAARNAPARASAPAPAQPATEAQIAQYRDLIQQAIEAEFAASWCDQDPTRLTGPQINGYINTLSKYVEGAQRRAGAA